MTGPVLADVEDGVTAVAEASVNQYKTAILLIAGAGWDAATDMDLEHVSDEVIAARGGLASLDARLDVSLDNAGTIKTGAVNKQTMMALDSAAAANGDAARYEEFAALTTRVTSVEDEVEDARGSCLNLDTRLDVSLNEDGSLKGGTSMITAQSQVNLGDIAAVAGDVVRYQEFTNQHTASGLHRTDVTIITRQAQMDLDTAAAAGGKAVRYDEFTQEHAAAGGHSAGIIDVVEMAAGALSGKGNTAARPAAAKAGYLYVNTQTAALERDTGGAFEEVTGVITAAKVTDLTDGGATDLHSHTAATLALEDCIFVDHVGQAVAGDTAPALPVYEVGGATGTTEITVLRAAYCYRSHIPQLTLRCHANNIHPSIAGTLKITVGGLSATLALPAAADVDTNLKLNVSTLTDLQTYEIAVIAYFASTTTHAIYVSKVTLWAVGSLPD